MTHPPAPGNNLPVLAVTGEPWRKRGIRNAIVLGGLALATALMLNSGSIATVGATLRDLPTALAISALVHLPQIVLAAMAWRTLVPADLRPSVRAMGADPMVPRIGRHASAGGGGHRSGRGGPVVDPPGRARRTRGRDRDG